MFLVLMFQERLESRLIVRSDLRERENEKEMDRRE